MAAPTPTARVLPAGIKLDDGFKCVTTFALDPDIELWEIETGIPGLDGGDPINTTTMHNVRWRTMAARALITLSEATIKAAFDPVVYTNLLSILNVETTITETFPDGSTLAYFGFMRMLTFDPLVEGTMPTCTVTKTPTNWDPVGKVEADPVLSSVSGT